MREFIKDDRITFSFAQEYNTSRTGTVVNVADSHALIVCFNNGPTFFWMDYKFLQLFSRKQSPSKSE